jgi:hypothetical protein
MLREILITALFTSYEHGYWHKNILTLDDVSEISVGSQTCQWHLRFWKPLTIHYLATFFLARTEKLSRVRSFAHWELKKPGFNCAVISLKHRLRS